MNDKATLILIKIVSVILPVAVALLAFFPELLKLGSWTQVLPHINATINSLTCLVMILALVAIKNGKIEIHKNLMLSALILGVCFLVCYVLYHSSTASVKFGDINGDGDLSDLELQAIGGMRSLYLGLLASHILLSIVVVPMVLLAFYFGLTQKIKQHKKLVRFAYPIWLYVSVTGVIVYFMIRTYY
ncbi:MAG: DUF420 domain-containing protein [Cyclobacteriaceae bacterium]